MFPGPAVQDCVLCLLYHVCVCVCLRKRCTNRGFPFPFIAVAIRLIHTGRLGAKFAFSLLFPKQADCASVSREGEESDFQVWCVYC